MKKINILVTKKEINKIEKIINLLKKAEKIRIELEKHGIKIGLVN